jgi:hypothetical protein
MIIFLMILEIIILITIGFINNSSENYLTIVILSFVLTGIIFIIINILSFIFLKRKMYIIFIFLNILWTSYSIYTINNFVI